MAAELTRLKECQNLVAGEWRAARGSQEVLLKDAQTGAPTGTLRSSTSEDLQAAVDAAQGAFAHWSRTPLRDRTALLFSFREQLRSNIAEISALASSEAGKTVAEARAAVEKGIEVVEFALSIQNLDRGGAMEVASGVSCEYRREPLGVVAGITPFNFPAMVPLWLFPIAVTLGNSFILKPSEKAARTACFLGELMQRAGYPAGVFSIVHGGKATAEAIALHPEVEALAFVGSTPAARALYAAATGRGARALCLGGAKNHLIVVPDADERVTVDGVVASFTGCAGQRCMAASVLVAVGQVDSLVEKIEQRARGLALGAEMGALVDAAAKERLVAAIEDAVRQGAELVLDGREAAPPAGAEGGNWLGPTILDRITPNMPCARTELFGPVLSIIRVNSLEEALELEEQSPFGNATSVFTTSGGVARYVAAKASAGMIGVNIGVPVPREPFSFGGTKHSKFGSGDITGDSALDFWSNRKKITTKWALQTDGSWMS